MKNIKLLVFIFLVDTLSLNAQEPSNLYPLEAKIKYHTDWTKNHYVGRLNEFSSDPAKDGDIIISFKYDEGTFIQSQLLNFTSS